MKHHQNLIQYSSELAPYLILLLKIPDNRSPSVPAVLKKKSMRLAETKASHLAGSRGDRWPRALFRDLKISFFNVGGSIAIVATVIDPKRDATRWM